MCPARRPRQAPTVAERCSAIAPELHREPNTGPNSTNSGRHWALWALCCAKIWPTLALAAFSPPKRSHLVRFRTNPVRIGPKTPMHGLSNIRASWGKLVGNFEAGGSSPVCRAAGIILLATPRDANSSLTLVVVFEACPAHMWIVSTPYGRETITRSADRGSTVRPLGCGRSGWWRDVGRAGHGGRPLAPLEPGLHGQTG